MTAQTPSMSEAADAVMKLTADWMNLARWPSETDKRLADVSKAIDLKIKVVEKEKRGEFDAQIYGQLVAMAEGLRVKIATALN